MAEIGHIIFSKDGTHMAIDAAADLHGRGEDVIDIIDGKDGGRVERLADSDADRVAKTLGYKLLCQIEPPLSSSEFEELKNHFTQTNYDQRPAPLAPLEQTLTTVAATR